MKTKLSLTEINEYLKRHADDDGNLVSFDAAMRIFDLSHRDEIDAIKLELGW